MFASICSVFHNRLYHNGVLVSETINLEKTEAKAIGTIRGIGVIRVLLYRYNKTRKS